MKRYVIFLFILFNLFFILGCSNTKHRLNKKTIMIDSLLSYEIYESDKISETRQDGKIYIHTVKIPLENLRNSEDKAFGKKVLDIARLPNSKISEKLGEYLATYDFSSENYALYNNRFDFVDEFGVKYKRFENLPIVNNGSVIGELLFIDNAFHCFSYVFLYISDNYLFTTRIELYRINPMVLESENYFFEKKNDDLLPYHWISELKRKEFYQTLESDGFKKLPQEFQLLRKSKDLFISSLKILDK